MAEPSPDLEGQPTDAQEHLRSRSDGALHPVQASAQRTPPPAKTGGIRRLLAIAGPGLITGAADDDPSGIATYVQTGAQFGYGQLWTALFVLPLMTAVQEASARLGAVTGKGLAAVMRERYSLRLVYSLVLLLLVASTINLGADIGAMAAAAQLIIPLPFVLLAVIATVSMVAREIFMPYARYVKVLKWLTVSLLAYPVTVFVVHEPWGTILRATFVPTLVFSPAFLFILTGVLGTTITPYMFFWEASQEVEEERRKGLVGKKGRPRIGRDAIRDLRIDNASGMLASQVVSWSIIIVGATVLHAGGVTTVNSAADAARALVPLVHTFPHAGTLAETLFAVGIMALGLLAVPVLAGSSAYAVAEVAGWPEGLNLELDQARGFYSIIALGMLVGLVINFVGLNPIKMLVVAAVINGVVAAPIIAALALLAANKEVMGEYRSGRLSNALTWLACLGMAGSAVGLLLSTL
ncbi:MAG: divalent metal cation transporter [Chloroflexi bacterium]|nr:divalent metal cation transporter [Chloroflexota bacterium]